MDESQIYIYKKIIFKIIILFMEMSEITHMDLLIDLLIETDMTKYKFDSLLHKIHNRDYLVLGSEKIVIIYKFASLSKCNDLDCFGSLSWHSAINKRGHFCKSKIKPILTEKVNINNEAKLLDFYKLYDNRLMIVNGNYCHNFEIKYKMSDCEKSDIRWLKNYHHILAIKNMIDLPDDVKKYIMSFILKLYL
jgi:hypothetical protein